MAKAYINGTEINKFVVDGGGELTTDWSKIGYIEIPTSIKSQYDYAKQIYDNWDASVTNRNRAFYGDTKLGYFPAVDTSNVTNMYDMFNGCTSLQIFPHLDTSKVTKMGHMFLGCTSLTSLDLSGWDTSKVTGMSGMFWDCGGLKSLDLSNFDTSKVTEMGRMFKGCSNLTTIIFGDKFDTSNVNALEDFSELFAKCTSLTSLDLSNFDTSKGTNMYAMFEGCNGLTTLDLSSFDTSNVTNMQNMLYCSKLKQVLGKLNLKSINSTISQYYFTGFSQQKELRQLTFENIGYGNKMTSFQTTYITNWGVNSDEVPNARQSLIDSLINLSFDRATAEYTNCTISMHANSKAVLTAEEIAQITAKGFTIA